MNKRKNDQTELFENLPDVLTVHQVRKVLGIGRTGVYKLLGQENGIRCFKIANAYKIPKSALIDYIRRNCKGGAAE